MPPFTKLGCANSRAELSVSQVMPALILVKTWVAMTEQIKFYSTADDYGEFSNFAGYPIKIGKKIWPTAEHYFQAMKFRDKGEQEKIRKSKSPMLAARMGRDRKRTLRQALRR